MKELRLEPAALVNAEVERHLAKIYFLPKNEARVFFKGSFRGELPSQSYNSVYEFKYDVEYDGTFSYLKEYGYHSRIFTLNCLAANNCFAQMSANNTKEQK